MEASLNAKDTDDEEDVQFFKICIFLLTQFIYKIFHKNHIKLYVVSGSTAG